MAQPILCQHCQKEIPAESYSFHSTRCIRRVMQSDRKKEEEKRESSEQEKKNMKNGGFEKEEEIIKDGRHQHGESMKGQGRKGARRVSEKEQDMFSCYLCDELYSVRDLDAHAKQCKNREIKCEDCALVFPMNLMQAHKNECDGIKEQGGIQVLEQNTAETILANVSPLSINQEPEPEQSLVNQRTETERIRDLERRAIDLNIILQFLQQSSEQIRRRMNQLEEFRIQNRRDVNELFSRIPNIGLRVSQDGELELIRESTGMSQQNIRRIPNKQYISNGRENDTCSICYTDFIHMEEVKNIPCKHLFHIDCLTEWLLINKHCPNCMRVVE